MASETGALQTLGCETIRDVKPGEIIALSNNALTVTQALPVVQPTAMCVFEHIYFARPDQVWGGVSVHKVRQQLGEELARELGNGLRNGMCRESSKISGDFCYHCHLGVGAFPARVSKMMDIPLQIWGEPPAEYGTFGAYGYDDLEEQDYDHYQKIFQAGVTPMDVLPDGYCDRDLEPFNWSDNYNVKAMASPVMYRMVESPRSMVTFPDPVF